MPPAKLKCQARFAHQPIEPFKALAHVRDSWGQQIRVAAPNPNNGLQPLQPMESQCLVL